MPTARKLIAGLALAFTAVSCTDKGPTAPDQTTNQAAPAAAAVNGPLTINNINQTFTNALGSATVTSATITSITRDAVGNLLASGTLTGTFTPVGGTATTFTQQFTNVPLLLDPQGSCRILHLDLGPLFLDVLGLQISLNEVVLDITAQSGPGNLLGNLLCAVAHLLDQSPINLAALDQLLAQINAILGSLLGGL
jgi:hypothetical protein